MRFVRRLFTIGGFLSLCFVVFNNFAPVKESPNAAGQGEYIFIDGKPYEKNSRGVYNVDGVPTFVKTEKPQPKVAPAPKNPNVGPPIDPSILKDAMGLDAKDEFFNSPDSAQ